MSLEAYDKNALVTGKLTKKKVELTTEKIIESLSAFKSQLMTKDQAFEAFAILTSSTLTALAILVASSNPKDKDKIVQLILNLI